MLAGTFTPLLAIRCSARMVTMSADTDPMHEQLGHVYWLGGGSGAGKSTIAQRLGRERGLRVYSTDDVMTEHAQRTAERESPALAAFAAMDMDERWANRSPRVMLDTFHWFRGEAFHLIVEDLLRLPPEPLVVEGFRLLPHLVKPLAAPGRALWLLPTAAFRRAALAERGSMWDIARRTSRPTRALGNLLARDGMFTERLRTEALDLGLPVIDVEQGMAEDQLLDLVSDAFGLRPRP